MRKSDKKLDNLLCAVLTNVCEKAIDHVSGFQWLTHTVDFSNYPNSIKVVCVFDTNESLNNFVDSEHNHYLTSLIHEQFESNHIRLKNVTKHVYYDSEQRCDEQNGGNWALRLTNDKRNSTLPSR